MRFLLFCLLALSSIIPVCRAQNALPTFEKALALYYQVNTADEASGIYSVGNNVFIDTKNGWRCFSLATGEFLYEVKGEQVFHWSRNGIWDAMKLRTDFGDARPWVPYNNLWGRDYTCSYICRASNGAAVMLISEYSEGSEKDKDPGRLVLTQSPSIKGETLYEFDEKGRFLYVVDVSRDLQHAIVYQRGLKAEKNTMLYYLLDLRTGKYTRIPDIPAQMRRESAEIAFADSGTRFFVHRNYDYATDTLQVYNTMTCTLSQRIPFFPAALTEAQRKMLASPLQGPTPPMGMSADGRRVIYLCNYGRLGIITDLGVGNEARPLVDTSMSKAYFALQYKRFKAELEEKQRAAAEQQAREGKKWSEAFSRERSGAPGPADVCVWCPACDGKRESRRTYTVDTYYGPGHAKVRTFEKGSLQQCERCSGKGYFYITQKEYDAGGYRKRS